MNTVPFPILTTESLTIRQLSIEDYPDIFNLRSDPKNNQFLNRQLCKTTEEAKNFINQVNENIEKGNNYYWTITITATKQLVGTICLFDFTNDKNSCELGFELSTSFQGQGIMHEAVESVIDFVFRTLQIKKIHAISHSGNKKSIQLLSKLNFIASNVIEIENGHLTVFTLTF